MKKFIVWIGIAFTLSGCAGKVDYFRPTTQASLASNSITIQRGRDAVWSSNVPELGKKFFVINNLDKASGLMNISYTGDPEAYIDCGRINSYVKNAQGERTHNFAGAKAQQTYEVLNPGSGLFFIDRRMSLEGRVNLIFEELGANATKVTVNTRYVVSRTRTIRNAVNNFPQTVNDNVSFNSGSGASFAANSQGEAFECVATGALERDILSVIR